MTSYDRKIHGFQLETTAEQDGRLIAHFNDRRNVGHFSLLFHSGADLSRVVLARACFSKRALSAATRCKALAAGVVFGDGPQRLGVTPSGNRAALR
jgi:hypothetical protein